MIKPRAQWRTGGYPGRAGNIPPEHRLEPGRALCRWGDAGWGQMVKEGKYENDYFSDELVEAVADLVRGDWQPTPYPTWVTAVPSRGRPRLVPDFAQRLAAELDLDDMVDSRWTLTVCGVLLKEAGSGPVFPVALATTAGGGDLE